MRLAHAAAPQNPASWADELLLDAETLNYYKTTDWARLGEWDMMVPIRLKALVEEQEVDDQLLQLAEKRVKEQERDEYEALEAAILDLIRLGRYERRAWSRQKRAIREFMKIKMTGVEIRSAPVAEERVV
jgi:predicted PhzF superfamily epimerase YddE/YHI9